MGKAENKETSGIKKENGKNQKVKSDGNWKVGTWNLRIRNTIYNITETKKHGRKSEN